EKDQISVLYEVPVLGGANRKLLRNVDSAVTFSPDGKRFAFVRHDQPKSYILIVSGGAGEQQFASAEKAEVFVSPSWSPDNSMIAYAVGSYSGGYQMTLVANRVEGGERKVISSRAWYSIR